MTMRVGQWNELTYLAQLEEVDEMSRAAGIVLFKHSTRCLISQVALRAFSRAWSSSRTRITVCFLDLSAHADISASIAQRYGVRHASPQVVLVRGGDGVLHQNQGAISYAAVLHSLRDAA